ncbi:MAG: hypothetical protein NC110_07340 [Ruminococcus sp.]|nr:hypothetical protein [Ruminococcus sp.]
MDNQPKIPTITDKQWYIIIGVSIVVTIIMGILNLLLGVLALFLSLVIGILIAKRSVQMDEIHEIHLKLYELQQQLNEMEKRNISDE